MPPDRWPCIHSSPLSRSFIYCKQGTFSQYTSLPTLIIKLFNHSSLQDILNTVKNKAKHLCMAWPLLTIQILHDFTCLFRSCIVCHSFKFWNVKTPTFSYDTCNFQAHCFLCLLPSSLPHRELLLTLQL